MRRLVVDETDVLVGCCFLTDSSCGATIDMELPVAVMQRTGHVTLWDSVEELVSCRG